MWTPGPFSFTAGAGVALTEGLRIALNASGEPVAASAAQRFIGTLHSDINGDNPAQRTGAVHERMFGLHSVTYGSATALVKGDFIMGASAGRVTKWAAIAVTKAMPAAGASASNDGYDLSLDPERGIQVQLVVPNLPALADTKTATFTFEDSADNSSFAAIASLTPTVLTGASAAGATGFTRTYLLPADHRQYVRVTATVQSAGGDSTAVTFTMNILLPKIGRADSAAAAAGQLVRARFF